MKQIWKGIEHRLSDNSSNELMFNKIKDDYEIALTLVWHKFELNYKGRRTI